MFLVSHGLFWDKEEILTTNVQKKKLIFRFSSKERGGGFTYVNAWARAKN